MKTVTVSAKGLKAVHRAVVKAFGRTPVGCDGVLLVSMDNYNALAKALNKLGVLKK